MRVAFYFDMTFEVFYLLFYFQTWTNRFSFWCNDTIIIITFDLYDKCWVTLMTVTWKLCITVIKWRCRKRVLIRCNIEFHLFFVTHSSIECKQYEKLNIYFIGNYNLITRIIYSYHLLTINITTLVGYVVLLMVCIKKDDHL